MIRLSECVGTGVEPKTKFPGKPWFWPFKLRFWAKNMVSKFDIIWAQVAKLTNDNLYFFTVLERFYWVRFFFCTPGIHPFTYVLLTLTYICVSCSHTNIHSIVAQAASSCCKRERWAKRAAGATRAPTWRQPRHLAVGENGQRSEPQGGQAKVAS